MLTAADEETPNIDDMAAAATNDIVGVCEKTAVWLKSASSMIMRLYTRMVLIFVCEGKTKVELRATHLLTAYQVYFLNFPNKKAIRNTDGSI